MGSNRQSLVYDSLFFSNEVVAMNVSVLRGFCKKCAGAIHLKQNGLKYLNETDYGWQPYHYFIKKKHDIEPVWFLSARQMDIITSSKEFAEFIETNEVDCWINPHDALAEFLKKEPFLVSKILKEAGEKKEVKK